MPINSTLQVAGFCLAVLALIMAMVTCSKYTNIRLDRVNYTSTTPVSRLKMAGQ